VTLKAGFARYHDGDVAGALASVTQALRLDDKLADAYYLRGLCLRDGAERAQALAALEKGVTLAPASIPIREELADLYASLDRRADELVQLQLLAGLDRTHAERQIAVGLAHARAHRFELAVLTLSNALERAPDDPAVYGAIGRVWLDASRVRDDAGGLNKARDALQRAASNRSATSDILTLYGKTLLAEGDVAGAERSLQEASTRYPIDPEGLLLYATAAERQNHLLAAREALIGYGALVASESDYVSRVGRIAALSLRLHEPDVAAAWLRRAQSTNPGDPRIAAGLADVERASRDGRQRPRG
jgi:Flp pilus assembly protein TadD